MDADDIKLTEIIVEEVRWQPASAVAVAAGYNVDAVGPTHAVTRAARDIAYGAFLAHICILSACGLVFLYNGLSMLLGMPLSSARARDLVIILGYMELLVLCRALVWGLTAVPDMTMWQQQWQPHQQSPYSAGFWIVCLLLCLTILVETYLRVSYLLFPCFKWSQPDVLHCDDDAVQYTTNMAYSVWNCFIAWMFVQIIRRIGPSL